MKGNQPIFIWPWSKSPQPLSHMEVANRDLEQAQLDLLKMEKERESAEGWVKILKERVERLQQYVGKQ